MGMDIITATANVVVADMDTIMVMAKGVAVNMAGIITVKVKAAVGDMASISMNKKKIAAVSISIIMDSLIRGLGEILGFFVS